MGIRLIGGPPPSEDAFSGTESTGRVLVLDRDATVRTTVETLITLAGCQVRGAQTPAEAVPLVRSWQPELILLEGSVPSGETVIAIRALRETAKWLIPIVLVGGASIEAEGLLDVLVTGYLPTPFDARELFAVLSRYVSCRRSSGR